MRTAYKICGAINHLKGAVVMKPNEFPALKGLQESEIDHLVQQLQKPASSTFPESGDKSGFGAEEEFPPSSDRSGTVGAE